MSENESIEQRARRDLTIRFDDDHEDIAIWEHSLRVANLAEHILMLPEVLSRRVDPLALEAAAYYHDAGWAIQFANGTVTRWEIRCRSTSDRQRALAANWIPKRLADLLPGPSLHLATVAVRQCNQRKPASLEAQILAEAENLEEIGPLAIYQQLRRCAAEGKALDATLETWRRQKEYRFWEARIKDCFHFDQTRQLARERLRIMAQCFDMLQDQAQGQDLKRALRTLADADHD